MLRYDRNVLRIASAIALDNGDMSNFDLNNSMDTIINTLLWRQVDPFSFEIIKSVLTRYKLTAILLSSS